MDIKLNLIHYGAVSSAVLCFLSLANGQATEKKGSDAGASSTPAVVYFEKSKMDAAFAKGAVVFGGSDSNYQVHASRRDQPGQAEVHGKYSDVIYVLQGNATFITGGEAVDGKTVAPDEIRANSIRGGDTRKISQGDLIIVPRGVPHQFVEVNSTFLYLVVKVR
jgi:quercetin dioxygenase-like cupin family protein